MTPAEVSRWLFNAPAKMEAGAQVALNSNVNPLIKDFKDRSPVDTGEYREGWEGYYPPTGALDAVVGIRNRTNYYNVFMEYGAEKHKAPWFYPHASKKRKRSGKLVVRNGRVWAGGLNPGHSHTYGGAIGPVLINKPSRARKIARDVADEMMRRLNG